MTRLTDYAIVVLSLYVQDREPAAHTARELASRANLPLPTVSKILKVLARRGLLSTHRGVKGGYSLAVGAHAVSVARIIDAMEGPLALTECCEGEPGHCRLEAGCPVTVNWKLVNQAVWQALDRVTLADIAGLGPRVLVTIGPRSATGGVSTGSA